jgi:hypothetical protein
MINAFVEQIKPIPARIVESVVTDLQLQERPVLPPASSILPPPEGVERTASIKVGDSAMDMEKIRKERRA